MTLPRVRQLVIRLPAALTLYASPTVQEPLLLGPRTETPVQVSVLTLSGFSRTLLILSA